MATISLYNRHDQHLAVSRVQYPTRLYLAAATPILSRIFVKTLDKCPFCSLLVFVCNLVLSLICLFDVLFDLCDMSLIEIISYFSDIYTFTPTTLQNCLEYFTKRVNAWWKVFQEIQGV